MPEKKRRTIVAPSVNFRIWLHANETAHSSRASALPPNAEIERRRVGPARRIRHGTTACPSRSGRFQPARLKTATVTPSGHRLSWSCPPFFLSFSRVGCPFGHEALGFGDRLLVIVVATSYGQDRTDKFGGSLVFASPQAWSSCLSISPSAPSRFAAWSTAPVRLVPIKTANLRSAPIRLARLKLARSNRHGPG